jgi:glucose-1-phosphate cytidylyltransferase
MKIFILCGGFGSRLDYEGTLIAKPMIRIGKKPILLHLIETFVKQGFNEFVICTGFKSETITNFFLKKKNKIKLLKKKKELTKIIYKVLSNEISIDFVYTGINVGTGGRVKTAYKNLKLNEDIFVTYGDGIADIKINNLIKFHYKNNALMTLTAVRPKERYGILKLSKNSKKVLNLDESKNKSNTFINGGYFIMSKTIINKIKNKSIYFEREPLNSVLKLKKLFAFKHDGFWKSLDTLKDKNEFNNILKAGKKPWIN